MAPNPTMLLSEIELPFAVWLVVGLTPALLAVAASLWLVRECFGRRIAAPPHCVSCGQSVYGGMKCCTECGQDLARHGAVAPSVRRARSVQRILLAIAATALLFFASIAALTVLREWQDAALARSSAADLAAHCMDGDPRSAGAAWRELQIRAHAEDDVIANEARRALLAEVVRMESADPLQESGRLWLHGLSEDATREMLENNRFRAAASPEMELALLLMNLDESQLTMIAEAVLDALDRGESGDMAARRLARRLALSFDPADAAASEAFDRLRRRIEAHPRWPSVRANQP